MDNLYLVFGLIAVSLVLLTLEMILPVGGIFFVLGMAGIITGIAMTFASGLSVGLTTLIVVLVILPTLFRLVLRLGPRTALGRKIFLPAPEDPEGFTTLSALQELESLKGRYGRTLSALRPSGITDFDGRRVDTISEGIPIEAGQWVKCIDVRAGRVLVRPIERPPDLGTLDPDEFR